MNKALFGFVMCILCIMAASSCSNSLVSNPQDIVFPDSNVSFQNHVQPLLRLGCAYSGCHSADSRAGNLVLIDYIDVFLFPGLVIPKNPDASTLVQISEGALQHSGVLFYYPNANQQKGLRIWVREGAKNN